MILYNVTISIDAAVEKEWLQWMKEIHIPDVMNTGFFIDNKICRIHAEEEGGKSYSIQYLAKSWNEYNQYQDQFALKLQQEHTHKFSGKLPLFEQY